MNIAARLVEEYRKLKESHPEEILLYQVGVFYKIMHEDAKKAAGPLDLKLFVTGEASCPVRCAGSPKAVWTSTWAGSCARGSRSRSARKSRRRTARCGAR